MQNQATTIDELNPNFIFQSSFTELLVQIASGKIDANELAKQELKNRGLDLEGKWVGFKKVAC